MCGCVNVCMTAAAVPQLVIFICAEILVFDRSMVLMLLHRSGLIHFGS